MLSSPTSVQMNGTLAHERLSRTDLIVLKHFWDAKYAENMNSRDLHYVCCSSYHTHFPMISRNLWSTISWSVRTYANNQRFLLQKLKFPLLPQYPSHKDLLPYCEIYHLIKSQPGAKIVSLGTGGNGVYIGLVVKRTLCLRRLLPFIPSIQQSPLPTSHSTN